MTPYLDALHTRVIVFDGALGTSIQHRQLTPADFGGSHLEGCHDALVLSRPDVIRHIHESFLAVGCDVVETCTFQATPRRLREWGLESRVRDINVSAAQIARRACVAFATPERPRFVAGAMGPTGMLPSSNDPLLSNVSFADLRDDYHRQARYLVEGGVDLLLLETMQDLIELKAALAGIRQLFGDIGRRLPIQAQVTLDTNGRMLLGTDIASALTLIEALGVDAIGLNCSTGPEHMRDAVRYLGEHTALPIAVIPNAGLPVNTGSGEVTYPLAPAPMAAMLAQFVADHGVRIVGGCCGTTPDHLAAIVTAVHAVTPRRVDPPRVARISSAIGATALKQEPPPLLVGERINGQGSRTVKRLLLSDDYDGLLEVARQQIASGAHVLDVCVAVTERSDEADQMAKVVTLLSASIDAPLMIDSTEPAVLARALEHVPGRAIVNSINMEHGRARIDAVVPLAVTHGAALVALCIDETGMARTSAHKLTVAKRIHDIVVGEYGLLPDALIFDPLTFTLATGDPEWIDSARETIAGLRLIKRELPDVSTILGISNVSFGLRAGARAVLNAVFLHHCVEAGLDAALVNPAEVRPYAEIPPDERRLADDLVFNRRPDALQRFIAHFDSAGTADTRPSGGSPHPTDSLTPRQKVHWMVVHRQKEGIEAALEAAGVRDQPIELLNQVLLPAMKEVGDKFGSGELILPFVLQSAEVMKRAVTYLERFLQRSDAYTKGTIVLATVYGDVHDIGKSLVATILANNGYTVHDLGKQVHTRTIVDKAIELEADAIGLSALLVSTSKQMPLCVQELHAQGIRVPVLIGGAAINRRFARRALFVDGDQPYAAGVFFCKDAFEALETLNTLHDADARAPFVQRAIEEARQDVFLHALPAPAGTATLPRSVTPPVRTVPTPPFFGTRLVQDIPLEELFALIDLRDLFRLQWRARGSGAGYDALVAREFEPRLASFQADAAREKWIVPKATYGYFPAQSAGNELIVYEPGAYTRDRARLPLARFEFPRQPRDEHLCLADYFKPIDSNEVDVAAFQIVTVGHGATERVERLQARGEYAQAFYTHGFAATMAEAIAEWMHGRVRRELNLPPQSGKRYSWGYAACPNVADHVQLLYLLAADETMGMQLTAGFQLVPEQSTAALIVHHPAAKYFSLRRALGDGDGGARG